MLKEIAEHLDTSVNTVVNAVFDYVLAPKTVKFTWTEHVDALRQLLLEAGITDSTQLYDFSSSEWDQKASFYALMQEVGLIEGLQTKRSVNFADRVICSFRLTMTGRVMAHLLHHEGGFQKVSERFQPPAVPDGAMR